MYLTKPMPEEIHTNRISKFETKQPAKGARQYSFISQLKAGQKVITHQFGEVILESIDYTGHQIMSILVQGTAGMRRETIYPLHIKSF